MKTRSVLVAEADSTSLELLCAVLTHHGFKVASTNDGGDAISRFFGATSDLVVCSTDIAGFSFERVCREVLNQKPDTRVVLLCGSELSEAGRLELIATLGCDAVLPQPFRFGPLRERLIEWGLLAAGKGHAAPTTPEWSFSVPAPPPLELAPPRAPPPPALADLIPGGVPVPPSASTPIEASSQTRLAVSDLPEIPLGSVVVEPTPPELPLPDLPLDAITETAASFTLPPLPQPTEEIDLSDLATPAAPPPSVVARPVFPSIPAPNLGTVPEVAPRTAPQKLASLPPSLPPAGDLVTMPLPRILFELYVATYSGVLRLARKKVQRAIYVWGGFPVRVDAEQLSESLGVLLREEGRITEAQYNEAQKVVLARNIKLGEALVAVGAIRESELLDALREQTERKLVNTFAWRDGTYQITYDTSFARGTVLNEIHPLKAIWRGVRESYDLNGLMSFFAKLRQRYVEATDLFEIHYDSLGPFLRDLDLPSLLNGRTTFEDALRADDSRGLELAQALYVLLVTDMVRPITRPGKAATVARRVASAAPPRAAVDYRDLMAAADRVAREYLRLKGSSYFAALEVTERSSNDEIEVAYQRCTARLAGDAAVAASSQDVVKRARQIIDTLSEARRVLLDPDARARYAQMIAKGEASIDITVDADDTDAAPAATSADVAAQRREALINAEQAFREGSRLLEGGNFVEARTQFEAAIRLSGSEPAYLAAMAQLILATESPESETEALAYLEGALRLDPTNLMANIEAAKLLRKRGQPQQAKNHLERVLQRAPHHQLAKKMMAELNLVT